MQCIYFEYGLDSVEMVLHVGSASIANRPMFPKASNAHYYLQASTLYGIFHFLLTLEGKRHVNMDISGFRIYWATCTYHV